MGQARSGEIAVLDNDYRRIHQPRQYRKNFAPVHLAKSAAIATL
jgi:hypothetical protein